MGNTRTPIRVHSLTSSWPFEIAETTPLLDADLGPSMSIGLSSLSSSTTSSASGSIDGERLAGRFPFPFFLAEGVGEGARLAFFIDGGGG